MPGEPIFKKAAIIGVGLIGGSMGQAINRKALAGKIIGLGRSPRSLELAVDYGSVHSYSTDFRDVAGCDLIIIATPVGTSLGILAELAPYVDDGTIITDVGSTKTSIVEEAEAVLPAGAVFIGGHPMAGSEQDGIKGADPYLFENAFYILTPAGGTPAQCLEKLTSLVEGIGARPVIMDPGEHDLSVAAVSHLPHVVAVTLVNCLFDMPGGEKKSLLAAGGFRDTTRIAAGSPEMWRDIFITNRDCILEALDCFTSRLEQFRRAIESREEDHIFDLLSRARNLKTGMPARRKGYLPAFWDIAVTVPDRPGVIGEITAILGKAGINICDIEILRVREGEGGTIRIAFASEADQESAAFLLAKSGIPTKKRL